MLFVCVETISVKINLQKNVFFDKYILLPDPLFSIIINSGAMIQLQTHIFVVDT